MSKSKRLKAHPKPNPELQELMESDPIIRKWQKQLEEQNKKEEARIDKVQQLLHESRQRVVGLQHKISHLGHEVAKETRTQIWLMQRKHRQTSNAMATLLLQIGRRKQLLLDTLKARKVEEAVKNGQTYETHRREKAHRADEQRTVLGPSNDTGGGQADPHPADGPGGGA